MKRNNCLVCHSDNLKKIFDLGNHPYADTFLNQAAKHRMLRVYNLSCQLCEDCGNIQLETQTSAEDRYSENDYSYTSSNSSVSKRHWQNFYEVTKKFANLNSDSFVCEIGSNDGFLLGQYKETVKSVLGVDASPYMADLANRSGVNTEVAIFNSDVSHRILEKRGSADLIIANNVFNHSETPLNFLQGVKKLLSKNGTFVFEVPYWKILVDSGKIDQIYHEHVTYMTVKSVEKMTELTGLVVVDVDVVDYHGGSLRVFIKHQDCQSDRLEGKINNMIDLENESGLFDVKTYDRMREEIKDRKIKFLKKVYKIKSNGGSIVAVGAAAKGNTLLNYLNLDASIVDCLTDSSVHKIGKYSPLSNIPIVNDDELLKYEDVNVLILSWNIADIIKKKLKTINKNIKFLNFYDF